ncbi:MAG TPA: hypothetical protein VEH27_05235, partial [Methylomirabilota bacterium]|nr:hypothetical protein [Methylomirabilota bacterium]
MNTVQQSSESQKLWQKTQHRGLIRYIPSGTFYARLRVKGKLLVRSLKTDVLTVAKLRLNDLEKSERKRAERVSGSGSVALTFGDALEIFRSLNFRPIKARSAKDKINLKPGTISYYEQRVVALHKSWPQLIKLPCSKVTASACAEWAARFASENSASAYNHTLGLMRHVFDIAMQRGAIYENPASGLIRAAEKPKKLTLPTADQFREFVAAIEKSGSGHSKPCANLVRFMAYGGFRKDEAAHVTWADCDLKAGR